MVRTVHMGYASLNGVDLVTPHALDKRVKEINTMVPLYIFLLFLPRWAGADRVREWSGRSVVPAGTAHHHPRAEREWAARQTGT